MSDDEQQDEMAYVIWLRVNSPGKPLNVSDPKVVGIMYALWEAGYRKVER